MKSQAKGKWKRKRGALCFSHHAPLSYLLKLPPREGESAGPCPYPALREVGCLEVLQRFIEGDWGCGTG